MNKNSAKSKGRSEFLHESYDFKEVTWTIYNVSLSRIVDCMVEGPTFPFASATWKLRLYTYDYKEGVGFVIERLNSLIPEQYVFFKFFFITSSGEEFESYTRSQWIQKNSESLFLSNYMEKSEFNEMLNFLAPNGNLTVKCQIRVKKITGIDRSSQVKTTALLSGADHVMNPPDFPPPLLDNKIFSDFKKMLLEEEDHDVIIKVKGSEFPAHRLILKARSPVFASTLRNDMKEKSTGIIDIEDLDPSSFSDFLSFLYCGDVGILSTENVFSLFTAADKYDVKDLQVKCMEFMKANLTVDTFCNTITLALRHSEADLVKLSTDFFAKNLQEIIVTVKWQAFLAENPTESNELFIKALVPNKSLI